MNFRSLILVLFSFIFISSYSNSLLVKSTKPNKKSGFQQSKVDYSIWKIILKKYIDKKGNVDYKLLKRDEKVLDEFVEELQDVKINGTWTDNDKIAFWINVYNAFTLKLILNNYPVKSIKEIKKPWDRKFFMVNGEYLSLGDVEHQILRKRFTEPRIHFAINCASKSCPRVVQIPYTGENLENLLNRQTKEYVNNSQFNSINKNSYELSKLFSWFSKDFKDAEGSVVNFINKYSDTKIKNQKNKGFLEYNWNLNTK